MSRTSKRIAIGVLVALVVLVVVVVITTPSFSSSDAITSWRTELHATEPIAIEPQPMLQAAEAESEKVTDWRTTLYATTKQQLSLQAVDGATVYHRRGTVCTIGGNIVFRTIITGCLAIGWDFKNGWNIIDGSLDVNHWGNTNALTLWEWVSSDTTMVKGGGINANGIEYRYRRAHFHFRRGIGDFAQHVYPWAALTVRGNGTCTADRYQQSGTLSC